MHNRHPISLPLTAALAAALGINVANPALAVNTWSVTDCTDDGGPATLRSLVANPNTLSLDTIDLSACKFSTISLSHGEVPITQPFLYLRGPAGGIVTVSGGANGRVFDHKPAVPGSLYINNLSISGHYASSAPLLKGGCIYSNGNVSLTESQVTGCSSSGPMIEGVGIFASGQVTLVSSEVTANSVSSLSSAQSRVFGVGIYASSLTARYSTISYNHGNLAPGYGGGAYIKNGFVSIQHSTISSNQVFNAGGGLDVIGGSFDINNSTISGNYGNPGGGLNLENATGYLYNNTVAFNHSSGRGGGIYLSGAANDITLQSTILANNVGSVPADFYVAAAWGGHLAGTSNLIMTLNVIGPANFLATQQDPKLAPLRSNGGVVKTHALTEDSPAIAMGNNLLGDTCDERGPGFPRTTSNGKVDIGAFEFDAIFANGFQ